MATIRIYSSTAGAAASGGFAGVMSPSGTLYANTLLLLAVPTSSAGLPSGAIWNNNGILSIVT